MAKPKIKPGTPHPNRGGLVMGKNGRYVAKSTYNRQVKASKPKPVKTNPTGAPRGAQGPANPPVQGPSRPTPSTIGGDTGRRGGPNQPARSAPPGIGKPPRFNPSIRTPGRTPGGAAGLAISAGAALGEAYRRTDRAKAESARGEGRRTFSSQKTPPTPYSKPPQSKSKPGVQGRNTKGGQGGSRAAVTRKPKQETKPKREVTSRNRRGRPTSYAQPVPPARRGMSNIPPQEGTGRGSPNDKKPVTRQNVTPKTQPKTQPKPKVKKGSGVSGVGPVASGRSYSTKVSGKSVTQQHADNLKKMGTKSERFKKIAAEEKRKSLERGKKNRERNNRVRRGGRR